MITKINIDKEKFFFILIKENKAIALVQEGKDNDNILVEIRHKEFESEVLREIERILFCEPNSPYMTDIGNWNYMKEFCFKSANLYGPYMWAYYDPDSKVIKCGFEIRIDNLF